MAETKEKLWIDLEPFWESEVSNTLHCDCGECFSKEELLYIISMFSEDDLVPHAQVVRATMYMCSYESVCAFFHMAVEQAAVEVNGEVADAYTKDIASAILKAFANKWNGCPEEACGGNWDEYGELPRVAG